MNPFASVYYAWNGCCQSCERPERLWYVSRLNASKYVSSVAFRQCPYNFVKNIGKNPNKPAAYSSISAKKSPMPSIKHR